MSLAAVTKSPAGQVLFLHAPKRSFMQTSCRPADLHAPPRSSPVAFPHESEGPFASSLWGQSWHGPPLRATPCSPQSFRSNTGWPALGLCRDPYTLWDPVPCSLIKHCWYRRRREKRMHFLVSFSQEVKHCTGLPRHCWYTNVQHVLGLEPNVAKYTSQINTDM